MSLETVSFLPANLSNKPVAAERAIVRDPEHDRWLSFTDPVDTLVAWDLGEVAAVIATAEAEADRGRWVVGFVSYDAGPAFDRANRSLRNENVPLAAFGVYAEPIDDPLDSGFFRCGEWLDSVTAAQYRAGVVAVKEHIAAGDTYQINLTYRSIASFEGSSLGLFRSLMDAQRAPHGVFLDLGRFALCSASPELFVHRAPLGGGRFELTSLPMKGTRPRGDTPARDEALAIELVSSEKDRAENTMILDMMRNDFGRIADIGSVKVPALHDVERYPTVLQMTSTVTAESSASLSAVFAATFPPASITGAPKIRTTELIAGLETTPRGAYCGAAGLMAPGGVATFNVAIRSVWVDNEAATATYGTGGGIVWDSDPADEWEETKVKTLVLERACRPIHLIETMAWLPGLGISNLDRHLERLASSAAALGRPLDLAAVTTTLEAIDAIEGQRARLLVGPDGSIELTLTPLDVPSCHRWTASLAATPVSSTDPALHHKSTLRHVYEHHRASRPDVDEVILFNERRELTETTIGNLVVESGGRLLTPTLGSGLLSGTFRAELLASDKITEAILLVDELRAADALFMVNAVRGWVELDLVD